MGLLGSIVVVGGVLAFTLKGGESKPKPKRAETMVMIAPLPPPPPPKIEPPKPEPPKEQPKEEMIEQEPVAAEEPPPSEEPAPEAPPDLGSNIVGDGPNTFGLKAGGGNGLPGGTGTRLGGRGGSRFGNSAFKIQSAIGGELRRNERTRKALFSGKASVWIDRTGRITRARGDTDNPVVNAALANDLVGFQLPEAPPADMPMPVQLRLSGRKP